VEDSARQRGPILILVDDADHGLVARKATAWERLLARTSAASLDRQLAAGTAPEASAIYALRALALVRPQQRQSLARTLRRILDEAAQPAYRLWPRVLPSRQSILDAADILAILIDRLLSPEPVSACGVAKVRALVHDGAGPLYYPADKYSLRLSAEDAVRAMKSQIA
jgi:hypothetical protein